MLGGRRSTPPLDPPRSNARGPASAAVQPTTPIREKQVEPMNRRPIDHLAPVTRIVLAGLLALGLAAGCGADSLPGDEPNALAGELGVDAGPSAADDDIDAITSASQCIYPPDFIYTSIGDPGWTFSAQLWRRNDGHSGGSCTNPGQNVPYCPAGSGGNGCASTFTLTPNRLFHIGCGGGNEYGIYCDGNEWIACPDSPTLTEAKFKEAAVIGGSNQPWSSWYAGFRLAPSATYTFPWHAPTTTYWGSDGLHVQCNYVANYGFFYLTY